MWAGRGWTYLLPIRTFSERERHDFTGHLQSLDTSFCIDRPGAAHSHSAIALPLTFLVAAILYQSTWSWLALHREKRSRFVPGQLWHERRCGYWSDL